MERRSPADQARTAIVADVGRRTIRVGLTNDHGALLPDTVRAYEAGGQPTVSGAISTFAREAGQANLPKRLGIAVAGIARGDTVSVTNGQWRVSRPGLAAMIGAPPVIINDFAATAWAVSSAGCAASGESLGGPCARLQEPGTFCIIGVGSGLGVAVMTRDSYGAVHVMPTEAGNVAFPSGLKEAEPLIDVIGTRYGFVTAEMLISAPGLVAIYKAIAAQRNTAPVTASMTAPGIAAVTADPREVVRLSRCARDPAAVAALSLFVRALWYLAGNLVLSFGAWDGVILTGGLAAALRSDLQRPELAGSFMLDGAYKRTLSTIPRSLIMLQHAELHGAAVALLAEDALRAFATGAAGTDQHLPLRHI